MKRKFASVSAFLNPCVLRTHAKHFSKRRCKVPVLLGILLCAAGLFAVPEKTFAQVPQDVFAIAEAGRTDFSYAPDSPPRHHTPTATPTPTATRAPKAIANTNTNSAPNRDRDSNIYADAHGDIHTDSDSDRHSDIHSNPNFEPKCNPSNGCASRGLFFYSQRRPTLGPGLSQS